MRTTEGAQRQGGPPLWQALQAGRNPARYFQTRRRRHGDPFWVELPKLGPILMSGTPEGARELFSAPPETFEPVPHNPVEPLLGPSSLILLGGSKHRSRRKLLMPPFSGQAMMSYGTIIQESTASAAAAALRVGSLKLLSFTRTITLQVIIKAIFGVQGKEREARFQEATETFLGAYTTPLLLVPALRRDMGFLTPWRTFRRAHAQLDHLLQAQIDERRREPEADRHDVLSLLMRATDEGGIGLRDDELKDELRTLLVAGHDTSASTLFWALYRSYSDPSILRWLVRNTESLPPTPNVEHCANDPALEATCSEAMRLHPVVPIVLRRLRGAHRFRGVELPSGTNIGLAVPLLHRQESLWKQPERFMPERFMGNKAGPFEFIPFGGGARRCLGAAFASYEMKIVLGTLLRCCRLSLRSRLHPQDIIKGITMGPNRDMRFAVYHLD